MVVICPTNCCNEAYAFNAGYKGQYADSTKLLFVLERSDHRALQPTLFNDDYVTALSKTQTGKILGNMLKYCDLTFDDIYLTNAFKCLLKDDVPPSVAQYRNCFSQFQKQYNEFQPKKIVLFGDKANKMVRNDWSFSLKRSNWELGTFEDAQLLALHHPRRIWSMSKSHRIQEFMMLREFLYDEIYGPE